MLEVIDGNLFSMTRGIIGHQVNCMGVIGSGVAVQVRNLFPDIFIRYCEFIRETNKSSCSPLGSCQIVQTSDNDALFVANIFGQFGFGKGERFTNYAALEAGLDYCFKFAASKGLPVGLPYKIGCDRGGGDWTLISEMINRLAEDHKVDVTLYRLQEN